MGKKKNQQPQRATKSFDQLVGEANRNALKPFIQDETLNLVRQLGKQLQVQLLENIGNVQTRIMALERILIKELNLNQTLIENTVLDIEDEATGYEEAKRPAKASDLLRVTIKTKDIKETEFQREVKKEIGSLAVEPYSLSEKVEKALIGASAGDVVEIPLNDDAGNLQVTVQVKIDRVSNRLFFDKPVPVEEVKNDTNA